MPRWEKEKSKERDGARRNLPLLFSFAITFEIKPKLRKGSVLPAPGSAGRSYTLTVTEAGHGMRSCTFPQGTSHSRRGDRQLVQAHAAHHAHALKTFELLLPLDEKKHFFRARNLMVSPSQCLVPWLVVQEPIRPKAAGSPERLLDTGCFHMTFFFCLLSSTRHTSTWRWVMGSNHQYTKVSCFSIHSQQAEYLSFKILSIFVATTVC